VKPGDTLLVRALRRPQTVADLCLTDWDLLVRQARASNLLARLQALVEQHGLGSRLPVQPAAHLASTGVLAEKQRRSVRLEVERLQRVLGRAHVPMMLLKGSAYELSRLPPARGRLYSDVDILVPRHLLAQAEKALLLDGWHTTHHDAYEQRYYREWMHELPPLQHIRRQSNLDVHHTIVPPTAKPRPSMEKFWASAQRLEGPQAVYVPSSPDLVLHSAVHLFHDGELEQGLRDLVDLDLLLRHFGVEPRFWIQLTARAAEMDLARPLFYALRYTQRILETPVPADAFAALRSFAPGAGLRVVMDGLFLRGLAPLHPSCADWLTPAARWLLYVRSHYLRMPVHLLLPHLLRKAWMRRIQG